MYLVYLGINSVTFRHKKGVEFRSLYFPSTTLMTHRKL